MPYKIWTPAEETLLKELVAEGKHSYRQMEKFFPGRTLSSLTCHARLCLDINNNIYKPHKYTYNKTFFRDPNPLNCYVCGFLSADASISTPLNASPQLRLELSDLDLEQLKIIKRAIGYNGVISPSGKIPHRLCYFKMTIDQDTMDDLALNFGVIPRKTYHLSPPDLKALENRVSFLAGLLDGDGCVHISKTNNNLSVGYVSASVVAVEWFKDTMNELKLPSLRTKKDPKIRSLSHFGLGEAYTLTYVGAKAVALVQVMQALKRDLKIPILDRKWDNLCLNQYISDFCEKYPGFKYNPPVFSVS